MTQTAEEKLEKLLNEEIERAKKLMPYWDWVIARLESSPQEHLLERRMWGDE